MEGMKMSATATATTSRIVEIETNVSALYEPASGAVEGLRGQIAGVERNPGARIDALETTIRGDIEQVHLRFDSIERAIGQDGTD
jgi:hypothetical protein